MAQCVRRYICQQSAQLDDARPLWLVLVRGGECCIDRKSENKDNVQWW